MTFLWLSGSKTIFSCSRWILSQNINFLEKITILKFKNELGNTLTVALEENSFPWPVLQRKLYFQFKRNSLKSFTKNLDEKFPVLRKKTIFTIKKMDWIEKWWKKIGGDKGGWNWKGIEIETGGEGTGFQRDCKGKMKRGMKWNLRISVVELYI